MTDGNEEPIGDLRKRFEDQLAEMKKANEEASKNATEASKRAETAERKLAFAEAGINLADKRAAVFVKGYDGELEPEKVKAAWSELFGSGEQQQSEQKGQQQLASEAAALNQMNQATSAAPLPTGQDQLNVIEGMDRVLRDGGSTEQLAAFMKANGLPVAEGF